MGVDSPTVSFEQGQVLGGPCPIEWLYPSLLGLADGPSRFFEDASGKRPAAASGATNGAAATPSTAN